MKIARPILLGLFLVGTLPSHADELDEVTASCELSSLELQFVQALVEHPGQARQEIRCDPQLQNFARSRAEDMAARRYFGHVTPERKGPNALLRATGYVMPEYYVGGVANNVESILGGEPNPETALATFLSSAVHRAHLLGQGEMYSQQQHFGVAYLNRPDSTHAHYWVVIIAEHGQSGQRMTCTPAPAICIKH